MPRILHGIAAAAHSKPTEAGKISAHNLTGRRARQPQRQRRLAQCAPDPMPGSAPGQLRGVRRSDRRRRARCAAVEDPARIAAAVRTGSDAGQSAAHGARWIQTGGSSRRGSGRNGAEDPAKLLRGFYAITNRTHKFFQNARTTDRTDTIYPISVLTIAGGNRAKQVPFTQYPFCTPTNDGQNRARHYVFAYWVKAAAPQLGSTRTPAQFSQNQHTEPATKKPPSVKARRDPDRTRGEQPRPLS